MIIGGYQKLSLIDYPGRPAAVIFTRGCNFRCPWCHNPQLVDPRRYADPLEEKEIFEDLRRRRSFVEAVVVTGGEPTIHQDLPEFLGRIKALGYAVKLDTNGSRPDLLGRILREGLADYLAMDVKAPLDRYERAAGVPVDAGDLRASIRLIRDSGLPHEFRTTMAWPFVEPSDVPGILAELGDGTPHRLQPYVVGPELTPNEISS